MQKVNYFTLTDEGFLSCFKRFFLFSHVFNVIYFVSVFYMYA